MDPELVLDRNGLDRVPLADTAAVIEKELRYQEERDALGPRWGVWESGEHQVDDVVGEVVVAPGDEDLGSVQEVRAVVV